MIPDQASQHPWRRKYGWWFAIWAGSVALMVAILVLPRDQADLSVDAWVGVLLLVAAPAFLAARVAAWLAPLAGGRAYGFRAALLTAILYGAIIVVSMVLHAFIGSAEPTHPGDLDRALLGEMLTAFQVASPFALLGTLMFQLVVELLPHGRTDQG